jgi:carboxymethylenebutenolidase
MGNYLVKPQVSSKGGVLVLHPWWGLNDFIKGFCGQLSENGYTALAVDLYDGKTASTIAEAEKLRGALTRRQAEPLLMASAEQLRAAIQGQSIGVVGFSLGAWWSLWLNERMSESIAATVLFYGTRGMKDVSTRSAFLGHFAETDPYVMVSGRKKLEKTLKAAGREVFFHVYPGTNHWFFESDRPEFQAEAAALAWQRTVEFLKSELGGA